MLKLEVRLGKEFNHRLTIRFAKIILKFKTKMEK